MTVPVTAPEAVRIGPQEIMHCFIFMDRDHGEVSGFCYEAGASVEVVPADA